MRRDRSKSISIDPSDDEGQIPAAIWPESAPRRIPLWAPAALRTLAATAATAALATWVAAPAVADTWRWPVRGAVLSDFAAAGGPYAAGQHRGVDIEAAPGTPVAAAVGGAVRFAGLVGSSGLTVSVRTIDGRFDTSYLHLATAAVRSGQAIAPGETIGATGTTGNPSSPQPHLHFGVRDAGTRRYRDPLDFLPPMAGVHDTPRGVPVAVPGPVRVAPAPQPVRARPLPWTVRAPAAASASSAVPVSDAPSAAAPARTGWTIACGALILAAALLSWRSSIDPRVVLRHNADLLRQR